MDVPSRDRKRTGYRFLTFDNLTLLSTSLEVVSFDSIIQVSKRKGNKINDLTKGEGGVRSVRVERSVYLDDR